MEWVSVEDRLPEHRQAVLVRRIEDDWGHHHTLSDGEGHEAWRWKACIFLKGKTCDELGEYEPRKPQDQWGNNLVPYCWDTFGALTLFGQQVTHWAAITDPMKRSE